LADLSTGYLPTDSIEIEEKDWIWVNHNRSAHLRHDLPHSAIGDIFLDYYKEYVRSIALVNEKGLEEVLCADMDNWI